MHQILKINFQATENSDFSMALCNNLTVEGLTLQAPGPHTSTGSNPGSPASRPAVCLWPGKAVEDSPKPWDPAHVWETWKKLLVPGFGIDSALTIAVTWGVNHRMEDLLCLSSS